MQASFDNMTLGGHKEDCDFSVLGLFHIVITAAKGVVPAIIFMHGIGKDTSPLY